MITSDDCRTCGACCVGGMDDDQGFATCTAEDIERMSQHVARQLVRQRLFTNKPDLWAATPTLVTEEFGASCKFLRGTPGRRCSCSIYETRPQVCRDFKPGNRRCLAVRMEIGLHV